MTRKDNETQKMIRDKVHSEGYEGIHSQSVQEDEISPKMAERMRAIEAAQRYEDFFWNVFKVGSIIILILLYFSLRG